MKKIANTKIVAPASSKESKLERVNDMEYDSLVEINLKIKRMKLAIKDLQESLNMSGTVLVANVEIDIERIALLCQEMTLEINTFHRLGE